MATKKDSDVKQAFDALLTLKRNYQHTADEELLIDRALNLLAKAGADD